MRSSVADAGGFVELILGPRVHDDAAAGDFDFVLSAEVIAAAESVDGEFAHCAGTSQEIRELDDAVHDGVFRVGVRRILERHQDRGALQERREGLKRMDELLHFLLIRRELPQAFHSVNDDHRRMAFLEQGSDQVEQSIEALFAERRVTADVFDGVGHVLGPEELQRRQMPEHLVVGLDEERRVDAVSPCNRDVIETDLLPKDGLAAAGRTH